MLTIHEIDILMEALDAWLSRDTSAFLMKGILGAMIAKTPEQEEELNSKLERDEEARKVSRRQEEEQVVLLKAKLIQMRDDVTIKEIAETIG